MVPVKMYQFSMTNQKYTLQKTTPPRTIQHKRTQSDNSYKQLNNRVRMILSQHSCNRNQIRTRKKNRYPRHTSRVVRAEQTRALFQDRLSGKTITDTSSGSFGANYSKTGIAWFKQHVNHSNLQAQQFIHSKETSDFSSFHKKTTTCQTENE